jgi:long-chain fatty acid transport protein
MKTQTGTAAGFVFSSMLLLGAQAANAAGFYLSEQGTPGSMGTAGVANVTNTFTADAAWTNPAGMTGITEDSMLGGLVVALSSVEFSSDVADRGGSDGGNAAETGYIPSFFYTRVVSPQSRFGFSVAAPFGGGLDYGDDFVGRYSVQNVILESLSFTPSYAYRVNDQFSVGAGVAIIFSTLDQEIAVNRTAALPDGQAKFEGLEDEGYQLILGLTYALNDNTLIGAVYRGETSVDLEGKLKLEGMPILDPPDQDVSIQWDNPQTLEVGLRHKLNDRQTLFFNLGWEEWSTFSRNELSVTTAGIVDVADRNWDDTWKLGAAYARRLDGGRIYTLGIAYETSPVEDRYRTFDFPVTEIWKLGGAYTWQGGGNLDFAVGATLYLYGDAPVDQTDQGVRAAGDFDEYTTLFVGGTMRYTF